MTRLALVLGDQLSLAHPALDTADAVLMIEAPGEATHVWSHVARIALFLTAMRHHCDALRARGRTVHYVALGDTPAPGLEQRLAEAIARLKPRTLVLAEPGDWRLAQAIPHVAAAAGVALEFVEDTHFLCSRVDFARWAGRQRGSLRMEFFYREMRRRHRVLLDAHGEPEGGQWNFDRDNRKAYPRSGPGEIPAPATFEPDAITRAVFDEVRERFPGHPGSLDRFAWPVTREQACLALQRFVDTRLAGFGDFQDAMWAGEPFGWHSLLSAALNLHLLDPREVIAAAEAAYREGRAPLAATEGFIRQVLGWREFVRGVYHLEMPALAEANHFGHDRPLPRWYWSGRTHMACLRDAIGQTLEHGYAHHIQRLMVTGLFALLAQVDPKAVAAWYLAIYVDAVEWVELPNVAGMALYANGGRFTSKPYVASGAYIQRMSNHCGGCRYAPEAAPRDGRPPCPFTVLYWAFLDRHEALLAANLRTALMAKNVARLAPPRRAQIRADAQALLARVDEI
jgi:deoxyribodipyrimidine photolyase-related protein